MNRESMVVLFCSSDHVSAQFCIVIATLVEQFALPCALAILDDDIVVGAIKTDEQLAVARNERAFEIGGLVVYVITGVVIVVEV